MNPVWIRSAPLLVVFGGPNGSGKSTIIQDYRRLPDFPTAYVNADEIARELGLADLAAAQEAYRRRKEFIRRRISFAMETVMSMPDKIRLLREAKRKGYYIHLVYITTEDPLINVCRVSDRVAKGGHDVPREKIIARYERSMKLLQQAMDIVDSADVYDNSADAAVLIADKDPARGLRLYEQKLPNHWQIDKLTELVVSSEKCSCESIVNKQKKERKRLTTSPKSINK